MSTIDIPSDIADSGEEGVEPRNRLTERLPALRPLSPVPTYLGIAVAAVGFAIIAVAWGRTAGETSVALQMPYLISGGLGGVGLILVGLTVINVAARRRDALLREQQTRLLADALGELGSALERESAR